MERARLAAERPAWESAVQQGCIVFANRELRSPSREPPQVTTADTWLFDVFLTLHYSDILKNDPMAYVAMRCASAKVDPEEVWRRLTLVERIYVPIRHAMGGR